MPSGISRLKCLRTLPKIIVGKNNGFGIVQLNELDELEFKLNHHFEVHSQYELLVSVVEKLRPQREFKSLKIEFYRGIAFPSWIGGPSFSKTVYISLRGCTQCVDLPPLGQLPLLRELHITKMDSVKSVGVEFYCNGSTLEIPFPSLEILQFYDMQEWEEWSFPYVVDFRGPFPCLRKLTIRSCPKLVSVPHFSLPSLLDLIIQHCDGAVLKSFTGLSSLTNLQIEKMSELNHLPKEFTNGLVSLKVLEIEDCATLVTLWENGIAPEEYLPSLQRLRVCRCPLLVQLLDEDRRLPCNLESLNLTSCENLERLPYVLKSHTSLKKVGIRFCPKLVWFPEDSLPPMLSHLWVDSCSLESIPNCFTRLEVLELSDCSSLRSLPTDTLISTLKHVSIVDYDGNSEWLKEMVKQSIMSGSFGISNWPNLERFEVRASEFKLDLRYQIDHSLSGSGLLTPNLTSLDISGFENLFSFPSQSQSLAFLKSLSIVNCKSFESFPDQNLLPNLEELLISNCKELKPLSECGLQSLSSLRHFTLHSVYPTLTSFPDSCFLPATLKSLCIEEFSNLKSLSKGPQNLTSLEHLKISYCLELESLSEGLRNLTSLTFMNIINCPKIESLSEGLRNLTSLKHLKIRDCHKLESLSDGLRNLTSLTFMSIINCPKIESLSEGLQNLTSLEDLEICDCPKLESLFEEFQKLTSLKHLTITRCDKLGSLPNETILDTLSSLEIIDCPLLEAQFSKEKGVDWPKIAHIPQVNIISNRRK